MLASAQSRVALAAFVLAAAGHRSPPSELSFPLPPPGQPWALGTGQRALGACAPGRSGQHSTHHSGLSRAGSCRSELKKGVANQGSPTLKSGVVGSLTCRRCDSRRSADFRATSAPYRLPPGPTASSVLTHVELSPARVPHHATGKHHLANCDLKVTAPACNPGSSE